MSSLELTVTAPSDDFGEAPTTFRTELGGVEAFRSRLRELNELCTENGLAEVRIFWSGDWLDHSGELCKVEYGTLVVSTTCLWFEALLKFSDVRLETQAIEIQEYLQDKAD